jgi:hypothetical protein
MAKIKEQINYGDRPERMDPRLERKLSSPEGMYAKSPALKKGAKDVERLVSARFGKVADKLKQATGIEDISSQQVQGMIFQEMMSKVPMITSIEGRHREELEQLAIDACLEEAQVPNDWFTIEAKLNRAPINISDFKLKPKKPQDAPPLEIPSFDVEDLTDEEIRELEIHKRNMINAMVQGAAKKGHYIFQKPEIKERLDEIDPRLYPAYLGIMAINDFMYFSMEQMIERMSQTGSGVAGKVKLENNEDEDEDEEDGEEKPDTKIVAEGLIFPILCHEIIKGLEESIGRHGLPEDPTMSQQVRDVTDVLSNEPMQLRIGPEIVEKIRFALPDEMFDDENKGLTPWFHSTLYKTDAKEFLEIIGNAISEDESKVKRATAKFREIMKKAQQSKKEYDEFKGEEGTQGSDDDDDDFGLDDLYRDLGIPRP